MQQVIVTIENGVPKIEVKGVKGKSCKDITKALEASLGDVENTTPTTEMYEQAQQNNQASR